MDNSSSKSITEPFVSILMLTYNRDSFIREAIESVLTQTYTNWELIIIDDGSTDTTAHVVETFNDHRIRYIHHSYNEGLHARRAESLMYATGMYTAILDSDDIWHSPLKLQKQISFLEAHPKHVMCGTNILIIDAEGKEIGKNTYASTDASIRNTLLIRNQFTHSSVVMRTQALLLTDGYQPLLAEDLDLFLQLGLHGLFANIPEFLTTHRIHAGSANDHGIKIITAVQKVIKKHRKYYPHYYFGYIKTIIYLMYFKMK